MAFKRSHKNSIKSHRLLCKTSACKAQVFVKAKQWKAKQATYPPTHPGNPVHFLFNLWDCFFIHLSEMYSHVTHVSSLLQTCSGPAPANTNGNLIKYGLLCVSLFCLGQRRVKLNLPVFIFPFIVLGQSQHGGENHPAWWINQMYCGWLNTHTRPYERHSLLPHNEAALWCSGFMPGDWCATDLLPSPYTPTIAHWALFRSVMHNVYTHRWSNVYSLSFFIYNVSKHWKQDFFFLNPYLLLFTLGVFQMAYLATIAVLWTMSSDWVST